jgi:hypothetical protein
LQELAIPLSVSASRLYFDSPSPNAFETSPALSCVDADGMRNGERLLDHHSSTTPSEYFRVSMSHPAVEEDIFLHDRLLDTSSMTRGTSSLC